MANIGIMGGTFNPIHLGHIKLAQAAYDELNLDKVWFMPSKTPPHKDSNDIVEAKHRVNMINLALQDYDYFELSNMELLREGTTYTSHTLEYLRVHYPRDTFYFIVGADSIFNIESWNRPSVLFDLASFVVARRDSLDYNKLEDKCRYLQTTYNASIYILTMDLVNISSSHIRNYYKSDIIENKHNNTIINYIDSKVNKYILENNLYH